MTTIFRTLHRDLRIPPDYHVARTMQNPESELERLSDYEWSRAVQRLKNAGAIAGTDQEDLLNAIVKRMARLSWNGERRPQKPVINLKPEIVDAIMADPHGCAYKIADKVGFSHKTIRRYRQQLFNEGRL